MTAQSADIAWMDAAALAAAFRAKTLSPVEVARHLLQRIAALDPQVNAVVHIDRTATVAMAMAAEKRYRAGTPLSPLDGVPVTIKDLLHLRGTPRRRGSLAFDPEALSSEDAPCVARLREAGAVFLAKTATPDAGCKVVTRSPVHGTTLNPYDPTRTPGGSSGGAAAALAMGFGPLAVGTDGAGSIRIPAAYSNVVGLKPGFGRVPAYPPDIDMPHSVIGPMTRTVADAAAMLAVMARDEPRDPYAWPVPFVLPSDLVDPKLDDLAIAVSPRLGMTPTLVDGEVDALVAAAGPLLADAGASVSAVDPAWSVDPLRAFLMFWDTGYAALADGFTANKQAVLDPVIQRAAARGRQVDILAYQRALADRLAIAAAAKAFFNRFDLLVGPVMPVPPYSADLSVPEGIDEDDWAWCPYTYLWNMTGQPAASVPIGFTASGLPVGVQIIGRMGGEEAVLRAAAAIERRRPFHQRHPSIAS